MMLSACGGGGGGGSIPSTPTGSQNPVPVGPTTSGGSILWGQSVISQLPYQGPVTAGNLSVTVAVRMSNPAGLMQYAAQASNPKSATYRQWLTPVQIGQRFGAPAADYQSAANYLAGFGLKVGMWPQREALSVSGSVGQFSRAFGTTFGKYQFMGKSIIAPSAAPKFPTNVPIVAISPMMTGTVAHPYLIHGTSSTFYGYSPQQVATGFDFSGAYASGINGSGINVGIIGTGPILNANGQSDDLNALAALWNAKVATLTEVDASPQPASTPNQGTGTGAVDPYPNGLAKVPPVTAPCQNPSFPTPPDYTTCNPEDGEAQLDTQTIASLAPGSTVLFYNAYNPGECVNPTTGAIDVPGSGGACPSGDEKYPEIGIQLTDDSIQQAIADNNADAISMSFGAPENLDAAFGYITGNPNAPGLGELENASLAAEGIAVFISSGDDGAWDCQDPATGHFLGVACPSYPATDPSVVAVGGVNIPLDQGGNLVGQISAWADNTTRGGGNCGPGFYCNNVGSGGGVSAVEPAPAWQTTVLGPSVTMREEPDMSLDADPNTGQSLFVNAAYGGAPSASGGTSMSAPESAAQWALVLQACKASATCNTGAAKGYRLGNPAPLYYAIYGMSSYAAAPLGGKFTSQLPYNQVFADVIYGGNQAVPGPASPAPASTPAGYQSGPGYDMVTGVGAPFTGHLIQAITGTKVP